MEETQNKISMDTVRQRYPEAADWSDRELLEALRRKNAPNTSFAEYVKPFQYDLATDIALDQGLTGNRTVDAAVIGAGHGLTSTIRGVKQMFGSEDTQSRLAEEEKAMDALYQSETGTAARVGQAGGWLAEGVAMTPVGKMLGMGLKVVPLIGDGIKAVEAAAMGTGIAGTAARVGQAATVGGLTGASMYVPEGSSRAEQAAFGAAGGGALGAMVEYPLLKMVIQPSVEKQKAWVGATLEKYDAVYAHNLIEKMGNKKGAHYATARQLGLSWQAAKDFAEVTGHAPPKLVGSVKEAKARLNDPEFFSKFMDEADLARINKIYGKGTEAAQKATATEVRSTMRDLTYHGWRDSKPLKAFDKGFGAIMSRVKEKSPRLAAGLQRFELGLKKDVWSRIHYADDFFANMNKMKNVVTESQWRTFNKLMLNDTRKAMTYAKRLPHGAEMAKAFPKADKVLNDLYSLTEKNYKVMGKRAGYWPRIARRDEDSMALITQHKDNGAALHGLSEADLQNPEKVSAALNKYVQQGAYNPQYAKGSKNLGKSRRINSITDDQLDAYTDLEAAFHSYVNDATHLVERNKFFKNYLGEHPDLMKSALGEELKHDTLKGLLMKSLKDDGLSPRDAADIAEILRARFGAGERGMSGMWSGVKDVTHATLIGDVFSTLTQVTDLYSSIYKQGIFNAVKGAYEAATGKGLSKEAALGLMDHVEDFASTAKSKVYLDKILTATGFRAIDKFGKETYMNASVLKNIQLADNPTAFAKKWGTLFEGDTERLRKELQNYKSPKDMTDNIALMLWDDLSKVQPISLSEMPQKYLEMNGGRLLYTLNSFTLKQFDILRNDVVNELAKGNIRKAAWNLTKYTTLFTALTGSMDGFKDFLLEQIGGPNDKRRDKTLVDYLGEAGLKAFGLNRYAMDKAMSSGDITQFIIDNVTAAAAPAKTLTKAVAQKDPSQLLEYVPGVGHSLHEYFKPSKDSTSTFKDMFNENEPIFKNVYGNSK